MLFRFLEGVLSFVGVFSSFPEPSSSALSESLGESEMVVGGAPVSLKSVILTGVDVPEVLALSLSHNGKNCKWWCEPRKIIW